MLHHPLLARLAKPSPVLTRTPRVQASRNPSMEEAAIGRISGDELFFDAVDELPPPDSGNGEPPATSQTLHSSQLSSPSPARRGAAAFSSVRLRRRAASGINEVSSVTSEVGLTPRERRLKVLADLKSSEEPDLGSNSDSQLGGNGEISQNFDAVDGTQMGKSETVDSPLADAGDGSGFLVFLAGMVVRAIGFQISLLLAIITVPIWLLTVSILLVTSPCRTVKRAKDAILAGFCSICASVLRWVSPIMDEQVRGRQHSVAKYALRFGWGCLWSIYVGCVLIGLLVTAFVTSRILMNWVVEEPIRIKENLSFDYTNVKPVAFVPVITCDGVSSGSGFREKVDIGKWDGAVVLQPNHKLQVRVSLTMPESDYNQRLGVFQVSIDFVSINGRVTTRSSHPCMLRYKSAPVRYIETFLKSGLLVAGYASESQILNLKMKGIVEGSEPTACLRVFLEQRAEFRPGAGIPELYDALLFVESELPFFKRIIWNWKKTVYIWTSLWIFLMELLFALVCCQPLVMPRARPRAASANRIPELASVQEQ